MAVSPDDYNRAIDAHRDEFDSMLETAARLHDVDANQRYGANLPYSFHLKAVAALVLQYARETLAAVDDLPAVYFGACFHDSIEDARLTYNDVVDRATHYLDRDHALTAAEIVYALTNDKGRTRAERAGDKYYAGIRMTPYAPLVKLADRLANLTYSLHSRDAYASHMVDVYRREMPHFITAITADGSDTRMMLPQPMLDCLNHLLDNH